MQIFGKWNKTKKPPRLKHLHTREPGDVCETFSHGSRPSQTSGVACRLGYPAAAANLSLRRYRTSGIRNRSTFRQLCRRPGTDPRQHSCRDRFRVCSPVHFSSSAVVPPLRSRVRASHHRLPINLHLAFQADVLAYRVAFQTLLPSSSQIDSAGACVRISALKHVTFLNYTCHHRG